MQGSTFTIDGQGIWLCGPTWPFVRETKTASFSILIYYTGIYLSFLKRRQGWCGEWKVDIRVPPRGVTVARNLLNIFLNDLEADLLDDPILTIYADDS